MNPSERAIEEAVDRLSASPGAFQRLAEDFAALEYPELFVSISPRGRNAYDVTVKGWPDFEAGEIAGEATTSKRWRDHLRADLGKAKAAGVSAFVFVAWAAEPSHEEARQLQDAAVKFLGLEPARVKFAFRAEVRRSLSQPRYARQWVQTLRLPVAAAPFLLITHASEAGDPANRLFGVDGSNASFLPTRTEYFQERVHRTNGLDAVLSQLSLDGIAYVTGRGASGKTALALTIAFTEPYRSQPAYYLDCGDVSDPAMISDRVLSVVSSRADRDTLFVVDNVHLQPDLAAEIAFHWRRAHAGSRLLLLGRSPVQVADSQGRVSPLRGLQTIQLQVVESDLLGVFRRIMTRVDHLGSPPIQLVEEWLKVFKGDLVAFSAAVNSQRHVLKSSYWELGPAHASDYIRDCYLEGLSDEERVALFRLSAMSVLELALPSACAPRLGFPISVHRGIVHKRPTAPPGGSEFLLAHSGVGELILAADPDANREGLYEEICRASPDAGLSIALKLRELRQPELAGALLRILWETEVWPTRSDRLDNLLHQARSLVSSGIAAARDVDSRLAANRELLVASLLGSPVHDIYKALNSTRSDFRQFYEILISDLATPQVLVKILNDSEDMLPHNMIGLLSVYKQQPSLRVFYRKLVEEIYKKGFTERQRTPILDSPLSIVTGLFRFLMAEYRTASNELRKFILAEENIELFVEKFYTNSLENMVAVLRDPFFAKALLARVDSETWFEKRTELAPSGPEALSSVAELLGSLGHGHLSRAICLGALRKPTAKAWGRPHVEVEDILLVLNSGGGEPFERVDQFLCIAVHDSGQARRLSWREVYDLTERMFDLAVGPEGAGHEPFRGSLYLNRMQESLDAKPILTDDDVLHALALEGLSCVMGLPGAVNPAGLIDHHGRNGLLRTSYVERLGSRDGVRAFAACWALKAWSSEEGLSPTINPDQALAFQWLVSGVSLPVALVPFSAELQAWLEGSASASTRGDTK